MARNIAENFNRLSRVHQRYRRQTTDGPSMTNSEHELEFTFANKTDRHDISSAKDFMFFCLFVFGLLAELLNKLWRIFLNKIFRIGIGFCYEKQLIKFRRDRDPMWIPDFHFV